MSTVSSHQPPVSGRQSPVVIVGAGLSGLVSAALLGRRGVPVVVLERSSAPGGRAATRDRNGFLFNLGPHALYRHGTLQRTLKDLGIIVSGGIATGSGGFAISGGRAHTLPIGPTSLLTTSVLGLAGKLEFARVYTRLPGIDPADLQHQTLASWLDRTFTHLEARQMFEMIVRVSTFTNDPERQSAGAAIEQVQLGLKGSVVYVDGGWRTIVDGLRRVATEAGVHLMPAASAISLERSEARIVDAVRLADGSTLRASSVILTGSPADVESLTGSSEIAAQLASPVRVATLDVALRALPKPRRTAAFGVDVPLYFSVHSALATLAPADGAVIHVAKYLRPEETADRTTESELETLMDMMQPGWRAQLEFTQFLPNLVVTHAEAIAAHGGVAGRPSARLDGFDNVVMAGDWVGARGQLSDACAASAADAVDLILASAAKHDLRSSATRPSSGRVTAVTAGGAPR